MTSLVRTDRLRDRGFIDQWGFFFFAFTGFAAIVSAKALGADTAWIAVGAIASMLIYAIIIGTVGTGRVRADQAGDNCYYLGLIYTLASLSYAIWTFDPSNTATTIVQGFGIALVTTIAGLILRVFFNQGRPDLENIEEQTRLEMTNAVVRLKSELSDVVRQLNDFTRIVQQSMVELQQSTTESIDSFTRNSVERIGIVVEAATSTIRDEANDFDARSKKYSTTFDRLLAKLDQHADGVAMMCEAQDSVQLVARAAEAAAGSASAAISSLREGAEQANASASSAQEIVSSVRVLVAGLSSSVAEVQNSLRDVREESDKRLEAMKLAPLQGISEAMSALSIASDALRKQATETAQLHATVHAGMAAKSEEALRVAQNFNSQLDLELQRSRELVARVHKSLADMTSELVSAVEKAT